MLREGRYSSSGRHEDRVRYMLLSEAMCLTVRFRSYCDDRNTYESGII